MSTAMETLTKAEVPEYLKQGELFRTLMDNSSDLKEEVTFPANALKPDTKVGCVDDCELLLNSLRFWGVTQPIVEELVSYALANWSPECIEVLRSFESAFDYMPALIGMLTAQPPDRGAIAIKSGRLELVKSLAKEQFPENASDLAAEVGNLDILLYLFHAGYHWNFNTPNIAARHGYTHIYTFLCEQGFTANYADLVMSTMGGHLDIVEYICTRRSCLFEGEAFLVDAAASHGRVHILQYFDRLGTRWAELTCERAAGQLGCLKFLHEHGCVWGENTFLNAAAWGNVPCMQYMYDQGCPVHPDTCTTAAEYGQLACLKYAREIGCSWDASTCKTAANSGSLECLQYAHDNGCSWDESACAAAATEGHLHIFQYLREHGCPWDRSTCSGAASKSHLSCLHFTPEHVLNVGAGTSPTADIASRCLACLQYAHQMGCPLLKEDFRDLNPLHNCYAYVNQHAI